MIGGEHPAKVEERPGTSRAPGATFYRWSCPCGKSGRWTRQYDTALTGAMRHDPMT